MADLAQLRVDLAGLMLSADPTTPATRERAYAAIRLAHERAGVDRASAARLSGDIVRRLRAAVAGPADNLRDRWAEVARSVAGGRARPPLARSPYSVAAGWGAPVARMLADLDALAKDPKTTDEALLAATQKAIDAIPDLLRKMDVDALAGTLGASMAAGMADGVKAATGGR